MRYSWIPLRITVDQYVGIQHQVINQILPKCADTKKSLLAYYLVFGSEPAFPKSLRFRKRTNSNESALKRLNYTENRGFTNGALKEN